jgi:hypothetical protein
MSADLSGDDLIDLLFTQEDRLTRATAEEICRRGATLAPRLAALLEDEELWSDHSPRWWALVHAYVLLARIRPPGVIDILILALDRASREGVDWILDEAPHLLGGFDPNALSSLQAAVKNEGLNSWCRIALLEALAKIGHRHPEATEDVLAFLRSTVREATEEVELPIFAAKYLLGFARPEDRDLLLASADGLLYAEEDVRDVYEGRTIPAVMISGDPLRFYDSDAIKDRQDRWREEAQVKREPEETEPVSPVPEVGGAFRSPYDEAPPPLWAGPKVGRNDPCPCASGKKFKKCCGG